MSFGFWFWLLVVLWALTGTIAMRPSPAPRPYLLGGNMLFLFILIVLLGWKAFGPPVHP